MLSLDCPVCLLMSLISVQLWFQGVSGNIDKISLVSHDAEMLPLLADNDLGSPDNLWSKDDDA